LPDRGPCGPAADAEREVRSALASNPLTASLAQAPLQVQAGGLSNHAWTTAVAGQAYFVRLSPPDPDRLGVDRESECSLLQVVARVGLAPAVVHCDPGRRLLVMRRVAGEPWRREQAIESRNIERLAGSLRSLHALPVSPGIRRVDFAAQAQHLESQGGAGCAAPDPLSSIAAGLFERVQAGAGAPTLCHSDLHHLNLVDDGARLWLVDWEYGGVGDPIYDLASFLCQHDAGTQERECLLEAYGTSPAVDAGRLTAACWVFDYVQWLWYRAWPSTAGDEYARRAQALEQRLRRASR
jgi:aminoglycoside phosphotransferase (APT) family kinase protein